MTDYPSKQKTCNKFAHLKFDKAKQLTDCIEKGDRISGDELLIALREHENGPLPALKGEIVNEHLKLTRVLHLKLTHPVCANVG